MCNFPRFLPPAAAAPIPSVLTFTGVEFNGLYSLDELNYLTLVIGGNTEPLVVQLPVDSAFLSQGLHGIAAPVMPSHHTQTGLPSVVLTTEGGATVHGIVLAIIGKLNHIETDLYEVIVLSG